ERKPRGEPPRGLPHAEDVRSRLPANERHHRQRRRGREQPELDELVAPGEDRDGRRGQQERECSERQEGYRRPQPAAPCATETRGGDQTDEQESWGDGPRRGAPLHAPTPP